MIEPVESNFNIHRSLVDPPVTASVLSSEIPDHEDVHLAQAISYLEAYNMHMGLLINFGAKSLEFKRVMK